MVTNTVAQSSQVCYTHLARGVSSRNRLLCAFVRSNCGIEVQSITTYLHCLSPLCALLCAQTDRFAEPYCTLPPWEEEFMKQKLKTHPALAKWVKSTGSGKIMGCQRALSHLGRTKSPHSARPRS